MEKEKFVGRIKNRPNFSSRQVRNVCEIEWGKEYRNHYFGGSEILTILRQKGTSGWVVVNKSSGGTTFTTDMSLADCGVIPYNDCIWNATNWLEKIEDIDNTIVSLENLKKRYDRILNNLVTLRFEINDAQDHLTELLNRLKSE